jgi:hypothetical protein
VAQVQRTDAVEGVKGPAGRHRLAPLSHRCYE